MTAEHGVVVSEYPPGVVPSRFRSMDARRLVGTLAGALVVIEAGARSGALEVARWAGLRGVRVFAVPGPVTAVTSAGCNGLLAGGAGVVVDPVGWVAGLGGAAG